jgi:hypothetical protein
MVFCFAEESSAPRVRRLIGRLLDLDLCRLADFLLSFSLDDKEGWLENCRDDPSWDWDGVTVSTVISASDAGFFTSFCNKKMNRSEKSGRNKNVQLQMYHTVLGTVRRKLKKEIPEIRPAEIYVYDLNVLTHHFATVKRFPFFSLPKTWNDNGNYKHNPSINVFLKTVKSTLLNLLVV